MNNLAENLVLGNSISSHYGCEKLQDFKNYFESFSYDAFKIDTATRSNGLLFTMLYVYHKLNWKHMIPNISEEAFK